MRISALKESLQSTLITAAFNAPSVVLLDDLDRIIPAEQEHSDSARSQLIAGYLVSIIRSHLTGRGVTIIATAQSKNSVNLSVVGSRIFEETLELKAPSKETRMQILESHLQGKRAAGIDFASLASQTHGYLPADLCVLSERAQYQALMRLASTENENQYTITSLDFSMALADYVPQTLKGIKLQSSTTEWKDVGGLSEIRQILRETLEMPTKFGPIFAQCPLKLRSGLLLYGYPGCGKTLLAGAIANECGLNFISVKGPEVLNKYIGASEKAIRDLFERAQSAKPCILFFDEFDSIAPKRGHDSTGVTDRVVNQMLTQMDGAETLDGVYVLAATSRPDLIDAALLRPGRLDKALICDLPSEEDRKSILTALSRTMSLAPDVNLAHVAALTKNYSGADLQAILYNAQLEAIHEHIHRTQDTRNHETSNEYPMTEFFEFNLMVHDPGKGKQIVNGDNQPRQIGKETRPSAGSFSRRYVSYFLDLANV